MGSKKFVEWMEEVPGRKAEVRNLLEKKRIFNHREQPVPHMANFGIKNDNIGGKNSYFLNDSSYISRL